MQLSSSGFSRFVCVLDMNAIEGSILFEMLMNRLNIIVQHTS
jgi:hypothetical protein